MIEVHKVSFLHKEFKMEVFNSPEQIVLIFEGYKHQFYNSDIYCDIDNCYISRLLREKFSGINSMLVSPVHCSINETHYRLLGACGQAKTFRVAIENKMETIIVLTRY